MSSQNYQIFFEKKGGKKGMENGLSLFDFKQFIKQKKKIIIITTVLTALVILGITLLMEFRDTEELPDEDLQVEETAEIDDVRVRELLEKETEELSQEDILAIEDYLFNEAYAFRVYIENVDGSVYGRTNLTEEILLSDEVISLIEEQTDYDIELIREYFLDIHYNSTNVLFTVTIGAGSEQVSQAISEAYYTSLNSGLIPVLDEKLVYLFEDAPVSVQSENNIQDVTEVEPEENNLIVNSILSLLVGLFLGFGFGLIVAYMYSLIEKKMHALYNLNLSKSDIYISLSGSKRNSNLINSDLIHAVSYPTDHKKLIICQESEVLDRLKETMKNNTLLDSTFGTEAAEIDPVIKFDEVIIIAQDGVTDKSWYVKQKNQIKLYNAVTKIIKL